MAYLHRKSINQYVNKKRNEDNERKVELQNSAKERHNVLLNKTKLIIEELSLPYTIEALLTDLEGTRNVLKSLFQEIFFKYGIELDDSVLKRIFGRTTIKGNNERVDTMSLFTNNTSFAGSLRKQFSTTQSGQANGMFSAFFMRSSGILEDFGNYPIEEFDEPIAKSCSTNNPFFREKQVIRILAKVYVTCYSKQKYS